MGIKNTQNLLKKQLDEILKPSTPSVELDIPDPLLLQILKELRDLSLKVDNLVINHIVAPKEANIKEQITINEKTYTGGFIPTIDIDDMKIKGSAPEKKTRKKDLSQSVKGIKSIKGN